MFRFEEGRDYLARALFNQLSRCPVRQKRCPEAGMIITD